MTELFTDTVLNMMTTTAEPEDYTGEDGLLYCGKCRTPKEAYFPEKQAAPFGRDRPPKLAVRSFKIAEKFVMRTATSCSMRALAIHPAK